MQKRILVMSAVGSLCVLGEIIKTKVQFTNTFKACRKEIQNELARINLLKQPQISSKSTTEFMNTITPQMENTLTAKTKKKFQTMKHFKSNHKQKILTSLYIVGVHGIGACVAPTFFYLSIIAYSLQSQISLINDIWMLKRGTYLINIPFSKINQLYFIGSSALCVLASLKFGFSKLAARVTTTELTKINKQ